MYLVVAISLSKKVMNVKGLFLFLIAENFVEELRDILTEEFRNIFEDYLGIAFEEHFWLTVEKYF